MQDVRASASCIAIRHLRRTVRFRTHLMRTNCWNSVLLQRRNLSLAGVELATQVIDCIVLRLVSDSQYQREYQHCSFKNPHRKTAILPESNGSSSPFLSAILRRLREKPGRSGSVGRDPVANRCMPTRGTGMRRTAFAPACTRRSRGAGSEVNPSPDPGLDRNRTVRSVPRRGSPT